MPCWQRSESFSYASTGSMPTAETIWSALIMAVRAHGRGGGVGHVDPDIHVRTAAKVPHEGLLSRSGFAVRVRGGCGRLPFFTGRRVGAFRGGGADAGGGPGGDGWGAGS